MNTIERKPEGVRLPGPGRIDIEPEPRAYGEVPVEAVTMTEWAAGRGYDVATRTYS